MSRLNEPGRFRGRGKSQGRGRGLGRGYFNKSLYSSSYRLEEVKFMTNSSKQVYTYTEAKDAIVHKVKNPMDMRCQLY